MTTKVFLFMAVLFCTKTAFSQNTEPDWQAHVPVPLNGRSNPYGFSKAEWPLVIQAGRIHTLKYPIEVTAALFPANFISGLFSKKLEEFFPDLAQFSTSDEVFSYLGLLPYPDEEQMGQYAIPYPDGVRPSYRMGYTQIEKYGVKGITFSCAACHASNLFGTKVLGLTNRSSRANSVFYWGQKGVMAIPSWVTPLFAHAKPGDLFLYKDLRKAMVQVGVKRPQALGLDTSLAQVALSLAHREKNSYADSNLSIALHPRAEPLSNESADSKPGVWWNLKYKNRWLSDGSVISGNPILTNFLWNEIGRGTDLHSLEKWIERSRAIIEELTTAVFSTEAPPITDFFPRDAINLEKAKAGEKLFEIYCAKCHGHYEKNWASSDPLKTIRVLYPSQTKVIDVGTDEHRSRGMRSLAQLNDLEISKHYGIQIEPQLGYVPPPLVGIWARWPYFHNNSVPSLCAVLTRHQNRPAFYYRGEAIDKNSDFDLNCNGYPSGASVPASWKKNFLNGYDTSLEGLSNKGHDEGIFLIDGKELMTDEEKKNLIVFLQTL